MLTLLDQLDKGTLWHSPGGIHPPEVKFLSNRTPISTLPLAAQYLLPVPQVGENAILAVKVGDKVLKGTPLTQGTSIWHLPVHAPTSGTVIAIEPRASNHASALPVNTCVIEADGDDTWCTQQADDVSTLSNQQIIDKIRHAGIAGMGGAAFPSHIKLNPVSEIDLVIINAVECEPYISADDRLMREYSQDILAGIAIIHQLLSPKRIVIAIEDNKPEAIKAMQAAVANCTLPKECIRVTVVPTKYPSGGEKQLIQIITGREVPSGSIPAKLGIVVHNVGTAYAIDQAVRLGKPLVERVVTVTGQNVAKPGNYWLPIGTPVAHILAQTQFTPEADQKVIIGGPMMGHALPDIQVPILKGTNCILVPSSQEIGPQPVEKACIRCGECATACPALLLPQQLFWHAKAEEYDKAASFNLKDCIECGCCSYVCPSDIPLVEYYRIAKSALKQADEEKQSAERAKVRFEARLARLEEEKLAREAKAKEAAERRKASMTGTDKNAVAEAMARIAAKKAAQAADTGEQTAAASTGDDNHAAPKGKAAVAAAIARAKAKKAALASEGSTMPTATTTSDVASDAKATVTPDTSAPAVLSQKDKVAAAVARAKAKKAALAGENTNKTTGTDTASSALEQPKTQAVIPENAHTDMIQTPVAHTALSTDDQKKARIAAAVAKAKAKQAAKATSDDSPSPATDTDIHTEVDVKAEAEAELSATPVSADEQKKARIAAAVAKAKAKKAAQTTRDDSPSPATDTDIHTEVDVKAETEAELSATPVSADEQKKARIAAAVAKAKAKQAAKALTETKE